jgi:hypothetical protein
LCWLIVGVAAERAPVIVTIMLVVCQLLVTVMYRLARLIQGGGMSKLEEMIFRSYENLGIFTPKEKSLESSSTISLYYYTLLVTCCGLIIIMNVDKSK